MVVWIFSGGGPAEVRGFIPFLEQAFPSLQFERRFPCGIKKNPKKLPRYGSDIAYKSAQKANAVGATGTDLRTQVRKRLIDAIDHEKKVADLIVAFDDLDCKDASRQCLLLRETIQNVLIEKSISIPYLVSFAAPELEAWIIADWKNTIAKDVSFKSYAHGIRQCLKTKNVNFDKPELFSQFSEEKGSCQEKLSIQIQSCISNVSITSYSKDVHTSRLIKMLDPSQVAKKCPHFRHLYTALQNFAEKQQITSCCPP